MQGNHKSRSLEEVCHGDGMLGIFKDEIKVEVLRKTVMGMGHWGLAGG